MISFHISRNDIIEISKDLPTYKAFQIFIRGPRDDKLMQFDQEVADYIKLNKLRIYAHTSYTNNLFSEDKRIKHKSIKNIQEELDLAKRMNFQGVIIHSHKKADYTVLNQFNNTNLLMIEYSAQEDPSITQVNAMHHPIVLDTAHLYAAGCEDYKNLIKSCRNLKLIHLNDTDSKFGSGRDSHVAVGKGHIFAKDKASLKWLINHCHRRNIDMIMELTSKEVMQSMEFITH